MYLRNIFRCMALHNLASKSKTRFVNSERYCSLKNLHWESLSEPRSVVIFYLKCSLLTENDAMASFDVGTFWLKY